MAPSDFDARFLGHFTTFNDSATSPPASGSSWIVTEKLYEQAVYLTKENFDNGVGLPLTAGLFLCHLEEDPAQIAFMRIYYQIPVTGTEDDLAKLAQQVIEPKVCSEREAFKQLMAQDCTAVPHYLGYQEPHDLVPGGYIDYLVWEKVPGESLTEEFFWSLDGQTRDDIRAKFRAAFEDIMRCGVESYPPRISKVIYDQSTGDVSTDKSSRISGFRQGWPVIDELKWSDDLYVLYGLAMSPKEQWGWYDHPKNWTI
ncbi:uncharacterized protein N7473_001453 [Penicillium subrubescens]|uniref:uncharacterized protein n=1 Tax=Penicillium subrubescens TaxID=1316194 RepID=UPI0025457965|nr:uncharacterized protein N7473_001453 [Penicillium subrubescens]KAJ5912150.1 hypothetical protein N7473_001453 [Penicillium subrubescens]